MKTALLALVSALLLVSGTLNAQSDTAHHAGGHQFGFAGGGLFQGGLMAPGDGLYGSLGLMAGLLVDRQLLIAAYGMNLPGSGLNEPVTDGPVPCDARFAMQHAGVWLGRSFRQREQAHLFAAVQLGWGRAQRRFEANTETPANATLPGDVEDDVFTFAPVVGVEISMSRSFRPSLYGGYRFVQGLDLPYMAAGDANGIFFGLNALLGSYGKKR